MLTGDRTTWSLLGTHRLSPLGRKGPFLLPGDPFSLTSNELIRKRIRISKRIVLFFYHLSVEWRNEGHCLLHFIYTSVLLFMGSFYKGRINRAITILTASGRQNTKNIWGIMMHITDKEPDIFDGHESKKKKVAFQLTICY